MQKDENIEQLLTRGVENVYPSKEALKNVLATDKKLKIYYGIDPTGQLHLGHAIQLKKLRQFQDMNHEIVILIGDFTARIGDPTDKLATRQQLSREQVEQNAKNYKQLIGKIMDMDRENIQFVYNAEWNNALKPEDLLNIASNFTVSQLLERDMYQQRLKSNKEIYLHEFLYPMFQAYDSVAMDVDMEIGGNDQTFNMLAGRTLVKRMKDKEKFVLTTKLLTDPTGKKMGKTEGNIIPLDASANEMFGGVMSWPDEIIISGFELLTEVPENEIEQMKTEMPDKLNPRDAKIRLAKEIVTCFWGSDEAEKAEKYFVETFSKGETPADVKKFKPQNYDISSILVESGLVESRSEARRVIEQGGVKLNGEVVRDFDAQVNPGAVLQKGKIFFLEIE